MEATRSIDSSQLAAYMASRIFHDLASPLTTLMHGCSVAFEEEMGLSMKAEGERMIRDGVQRIAAKIQFMRYALGSQEINDNQTDLHRAKQLFEVLFDAYNQKLDWRMETQKVSNRQMRLLMNMTMMAMESAGKEGVVTVRAHETDGDLVLEVSYIGRSDFRLDVREALQGKTPEQGWGGGAVQPLFSKLMAEQIGMSLETQPHQGGGALVAKGPLAVFS
jgi:histidine phosphotransferase ChpT